MIVPFTEAELDQVSAGFTFMEYLNKAYNVGTVPYQTAKLGPGLHK
jgi:hypothetical protein